MRKAKTMELPAMDRDMKVRCYWEAPAAAWIASFEVRGQTRIIKYGDTEQKALEWLISDVVSVNMTDESTLRRGKLLAAHLEARLAELPEEGEPK